jgi:endonuclease YncB( thermonuclease family)
MMRNCTSLIIIFTLFFLGVPALNLAWAQGQEVRVFDGDTFSVSGEVIRLWGIDAVEAKQSCSMRGVSYSCGSVSRAYLQALIDPGSLECQEKPKAPRETRKVAQCFVKGKDLGQLMVSAGWAVDYLHFSKGFYAEDEAQAKKAQRGFWAGEFQNPKDWRNAHPR